MKKKKGYRLRTKKALEKVESKNRLTRIKQEMYEESNWETVAPGPALFVKETMMEQLLKRNPIKDLGLNTHIKIQTHIPEGEVQPLPDKYPLEKT